MKTITYPLVMYYIKIINEAGIVKNKSNGKKRSLSKEEIVKLFVEFPNLQNSRNVTYFRNRIQSIGNLP